MTDCPTASGAAVLLTLRFNGEALQLPAGCTLAQLVDRHAAGPQALATAVNGRFVPREQRGQTRLQAGDEVLTFEAIVGG
jgi:sulfur carrier protein